jgi:hypothetical protein
MVDRKWQVGVECFTDGFSIILSLDSGECIEVRLDSVGDLFEDLLRSAGELFVQFLAASNAAFHAVFTGRSMSFSLLRGISQKLAPSTREEFSKY